MNKLNKHGADRVTENANFKNKTKVIKIRNCKKQIYVNLLQIKTIANGNIVLQK